MRLQHAFLAALALAAGPASADPIRPAATPAATRQAIQAAIDAAANASPAGTVTLGAGTFQIDAQLMVTGGVTLVGQGWDDTVLGQTAVDRVATLEGGSRIEGVTVTGGQLDAGWANGAGLNVKNGTVSRCRVWRNGSTATHNVWGAGVFIESGTIDHSIVAFNGLTANASGGAGISTYNSSGTITIDACLVYGNTAAGSDNASKGGGICINMGNPTVTIRNTTIAGNSSSGSAGGFHNGSYGSKVKLVNTIVSGNSAPSDADAASGTLASGSSNNLLGGTPWFVNAAGHDYHLGPRSSAIGAGTAWEGIDKDLDGAAFASPPSIGCYEFYGTPMAKDPVFDPATGVTFNPTVAVALSCGTDGATIRYTTDGSDPTAESPAYAEPILLSATTTIKARAYREGMLASDIVSATYALGKPTPPELGEVTVEPGSTSAILSGEILSVGNNLATSCDVYLAYDTKASRLGEPALVVSGATTSFSYRIRGLNPNTTYYYALVVSNNAQIAKTASMRGQFATSDKQGLQPVAGNPAATRARIQEEIDGAAAESPAGTVVLGEGVFEIDAQLMVTGGVRVVGLGWAKTVVKQTVAGNTARCATVSGGAKLEGVTLTGGHIRAAWQHGAGVFVEDGTVSWCCITNNQTGDKTTVTTVNNNYGAGIHIQQGSVDHTIIALNTAYANGGGNSHGGGLGIQNPTGPVLVETCLFYGNRAPNGNGGAICADFGIYHNRLTVRNTTIANNEASGEGGGVYATEYYAANKFSFALVNAILADNVSGGEGADPNLKLPGDERILSGYAAQSFGNLFANGTPVLGTNSTSIAGAGASWFVKPENGNYHLPSGSFAVGTGRWYQGIAEDLDRSRRLKRPAAGCYEAQFCTILILR